MVWTWYCRPPPEGTIRSGDSVRPLGPRDLPVPDAVGGFELHRRAVHLHDIAQLGVVVEPLAVRRRDVDAAVGHVAVALGAGRPVGGVHELAAVGDPDAP